MAIALGLNGARVACLARNAEKLAETVQTIADAGGQAEAFSCDVKSREAIDGVIDKIADEWGRLDIMVNNAGITRDTLLPRMTDDEWDDVIQTNLRGTFLFCRAASRYMMRARYGRLINIASVSGLIGNPGQTNYSASKAGVIGMTKSLGKELADTEIRVHSVAPAVIHTPMLDQVSQETIDYMVSKIPVGRTGRPDEVAALVHYLASEDCSFTTGSCFDISGGRATY